MHIVPCKVQRQTAGWALTLALVHFVPVRVTGYQDVNVQLTLHHCERIWVAPGDYLVPVDEPDLELTNLDHFAVRVRSVVVETACKCGTAIEVTR